MANLDQTSLQFQPVNNQEVPQEGPKAIPIKLDFSKATEYDLDLQNLQERGFIAMVQSIYVDASAATAATIVAFNSTNQNITAKAATQGYYSVLCPNPPKMKFINTSGSDQVVVFLLNVPVAGVVWATA